MPSTLASTICPRPADPTAPANWRIVITEPIPAPSYIRIGDEPYSENVDVWKCTGNGPYLLRLAKNISRAHPDGAPITVLKSVEEVRR